MQFLCHKNRHNSLFYKEFQQIRIGFPNRFSAQLIQPGYKRKTNGDQDRRKHIGNGYFFIADQIQSDTEDQNISDKRQILKRKVCHDRHDQFRKNCNEPLKKQQWNC